MQVLLDDITREMDKLAFDQTPNLIGLLSILLARAQGKLMAGPAPVMREAEELLTVPEVAQWLKMSSYRVHELCRQQKVKSVKLGRSVRVTPFAVAEYLATQGT